MSVFFGLYSKVITSVYILKKTNKQTVDVAMRQWMVEELRTWVPSLDHLGLVPSLTSKFSTTGHINIYLWAIFSVKI